MTRIISGRAGGISLAVPPRGTRPTSDRVRESLFAALEASGVIVGARVADLYAGSGALALEALSRGAASADLVEKAEAAASVARRNAALVAKAMGAAPPARVHRASVTGFLAGPLAGRYDLVFLDPPYDLSDGDLAAALTALASRLDQDAVVVVERGSRSPAPDWQAAGLTALRERSYGDTTMWWGQPRPESQSR